MKSFIWMGGITIILIAIMFWAVGGSGPSSGLAFEAGVVNPLDHVKGLPAQAGNASSTIVFIEYSDFQCPACRTYYPMMRELMAEYGSRAAFVYRHFPLRQIHPNAEPAAWAAEAAGKQGKFWEMHDLLFEKQNEWAAKSDILPLFESYAALLGLSLQQFKADMLSQEAKDFVKAQELSAVELGIPGTPAFFVNGIQVKNPASIEEFRAVMDKQP